LNAAVFSALRKFLFTLPAHSFWKCCVAIFLHGGQGTRAQKFKGWWRSGQNQIRHTEFCLVCSRSGSEISYGAFNFVRRVSWPTVVFLARSNPCKMKYFYIAHMSIPRMLTALGVYIQMYRDRPCQGFEPRSPACQLSALTTRLNPRSTCITCVL
jgi:hypothetical protein